MQGNNTLFFPQSVGKVQLFFFQRTFCFRAGIEHGYIHWYVALHGGAYNIPVGTEKLKVKSPAISCRLGCDSQVHHGE